MHKVSKNYHVVNVFINTRAEEIEERISFGISGL